MIYCVCGTPVKHERAILGYKNCLECGEREAQKIKNYRRKCIAPAYNKGAYQYVYSINDAKDVGK